MEAGRSHSEWYDVLIMRIIIHPGVGEGLQMDVMDPGGSILPLNDIHGLTAGSAGLAPRALLEHALKLLARLHASTPTSVLLISGIQNSMPSRHGPSK